MPRTFDPPPLQAGPGSKLGKGVQGRRTGRLKKKTRKVALVDSPEEGYLLQQQPQKQSQASENLSWCEATSINNKDESPGITTQAKAVGSSKTTANHTKTKKVLEGLFDGDEDDDVGTTAVDSQKDKARSLPRVSLSGDSQHSPKSTLPKNNKSRPDSHSKSSLASAAAKGNTTPMPTMLPGDQKVRNNLNSAAKLFKKKRKSSSLSLSSSRIYAEATIPAFTPKRATTKKAKPTVTIQKTGKKSNAVPSVSSPPDDGLPLEAAGPSRSLTVTPSSLVAPSSLSSPPPPPPKSRCALAFDTRFLDTPQSQETATKLTQEGQIFCNCLVARGVPPCLVVSSISADVKGSKTSATVRHRYAVGVQVVQLENDKEESNPFSPTWIPPPTAKISNQASATSRRAVKVPKPLLANDSWKHFGELVEKVIEHDAKKQSEAIDGFSNGRQQLVSHNRRPLDLTIVSNDVSLFCDTNGASHKRALSRFCDLVKPFFADRTIRTLDIVLMKTRTIAIAKDSEVDDMELESSDDELESMVDMSGSEDDALEVIRTKRDRRARNDQEKAIANCVRALKMHLENRSQAERKKNPTGANIEITFSMLDASAHPRLAFKSLMRSCLRESVSSATILYSASSTGTTKLVQSATNIIRLNLPETLDGMQSSVSFEVSYKILPFGLDRSVTAAGFFLDLKELASSDLEVVQLVPLSLVDASFLFGVPMSVRAGLEADFDEFQFTEMRVLTRSLFRALQRKQVAMLLRLRKQKKTTIDTEKESCVFHNALVGQTFLLMAEEMKGGQAHPNTGLLFRYASGEDLLLEPEQPSVAEVDADIEQAYNSYCYNALDRLDCGAVNPLYLDAIAIHPKQGNVRKRDSSPLQEKDDDDRTTAKAHERRDSSRSEVLLLDSDDEDDGDHDFYAFSYPTQPSQDD